MPQSGVLAKSNGVITRTDDSQMDVKIVENTTTKTNYAIGQIGTEGALEDVTVTLGSPVASLVNGNTDKTLQNIQTNGGDVILIAQGDKASLGTSGTDPLIIDAANGTVKVRTPDNAETIAVNTYLVLTQDTTLTPENIIVDGVEYKVVGKAQDSTDKVDITCGSLRVINGGLADISTDGTLYFTYLGVDDQNSTGNSKAVLQAAESITVEELNTVGGTTELTSTGGSVTVTELTATDNASVTADAATAFESETMDVTGSTVSVTGGGTGKITDLTATDNAKVTVDVDSDFESESMKVTGSTVSVTGGGTGKITNLTATEKASVTVDVDSNFESETMKVTGSEVSVTGGGTGKITDLTATESANVTVDVATAFESERMEVTGSTVSVTSDGTGKITNLTATESANVTVDVATAFESESMDLTGSAVTVTSDGTAQITDLTASDSAAVQVHTAGDITLGTLDLEDAAAVFTSLNDANGYALPGSGSITGGGKFTADYVEADRSRLEIDVWQDLRIFDETGDEASGEDRMENVLVLRDMHGSQTVGNTQQKRGAFLTSRNGAVDSTHDDYSVYTAGDGSAFFLQDGQWYALEGSGDSLRFVKLEAAPDLTGYTDRGRYSLYIGSSDENASGYLPEYAGVLVLERSGDFYQIAADGIQKDDHLSSDFIDAQKLLNVGARNYYDSWFTDNADLTVSALGDIQVRDGLLLTNSTNANLTSNAGGIIVADYFMDTDGDGIGDKLQPSRYLVKNSVAELTALGGDVRTDRVYVETSFAAIDDCTGDVNSKTWYILGSKFPINLDGDVTVVCLDADSASAVPAAQILWSNEDFYIHLLMDGAYKYIQTGVDITSRNGMVRIESMDGDVSSSNTLDLYATASTVDIQAAKGVRIPEMELNTPNEQIKLDDGLTPATGNVYHDRVYKLVDGQYTQMTEAAIPDPAEHAYGTVMNITATDGGFIANNIKVSGALTPQGEVYTAHGISELNVQTGGAIDISYNLSGRTQEHIDQYGQNIADRALTIQDGSKVRLQSEKGGVSVLGHDADVCREDILLAGTSGENAVLQMIADDGLETGSITASSAKLYLRTTGAEADAEDNDIRVDRIVGTDVAAELDSAGSINALTGNSSLLLKLDGDTSLRLAAAGDIGTPEQFAHIDVPCTIVVDKVSGFYADLNLRDSDDNRIYSEIRDYAITQGYLASDADAMVQKLISIREEDYLGHSDLRFYNVLLSEETLGAIRTALNMKAGEDLTADDLVNGFALLDDQTRTDVLSSLYNAAVSNGQGLSDIETALTEQEDALRSILAEKQKLAQRMGQEKPLKAEELAQCKARYDSLVEQEKGIRARIQELSKRKADIEDSYRAYAAEDPEMNGLMDQAEALYAQAQQLEADSDQLTAEATALQTALDALLTKLLNHDAFHETSLETGRKAAEVVLNAAKLAGEKVNAAEQAALALAVSCEEQDRKAAAENLNAMASLAAAMGDLALDAYAGTQMLNNIFVDVPARSSQILIGEIEGALYLNNEGDIHVLVDSGRTLTSEFDPNPASHIQVEANPLLVGEILSRRGDVTIENVNGAIDAKKLEDGKANVVADEISLKAQGSIGSAQQPLVTEQRDVTPSKITAPVEDIYRNQNAEETVSGSALPGKGVIGIQLAQRYDELSDETQTVAVTLLMADGTELKTHMALQDLRQLTRQANTTDGCVYNFLTDEKATLAALQVVVRYDWVRYLDPKAGTRTDAESENGSVYLSELTGTMHIGRIQAKDDISITAPDGVYSVLTEEELASGQQNIHTTGGDSQVTVDAGTGGVGESGRPLRVQISGEHPLMTTTSQDGVYVQGTGDLELEFEDTSRHIEIELIASDNPNGIANLTVNDRTVDGSDTLTGYAKSLGSLELHTQADVGTQTDPFEIVTDAAKGGTLILSGDDVNLLQKQGDLLAENVTAKGDLRMDVGGNLLDASDSLLTDLLRQYRQQLADTNAQQAVLDELQAQWNAIMNNDMDAKRKQELADARDNAAQAQAKAADAAENKQNAQEALTQANKALSQALASGDKTAIAAAQEAVTKAQQELTEKADALAQANAQNQAAQERLKAAEAIEAKFTALEKAKQNLENAYAGGNPAEIDQARKAYDAAREATAPYTDYVERAKADVDAAETILKNAFGDDYRTALENAPADVAAKYQPIVELLDNAQKALREAQARLEVLNGDANTPGSIAEAQQRLEEEKAALEALIGQIQKSQQQGDSLAIQVGGDADIHTGGSIAGSTRNPDEDYVSIQVGGELNMEADGTISLISPEEIRIGEAITNGNSLNLISLGDVTVGSTDATEFSAAGDNIAVDLEDNVSLGDVIAEGSVDITTDGSIDQKPGTAIRGEELEIQAGGSVAVDVYVDRIQVTAGEAVDITSGKSDLVIDGIKAGTDVSIDGPGNLVSGGGIDIDSGGNVTIHMGGNIGFVDAELAIRAAGGIIATSVYGLSFIRRIVDTGASEQTEGHGLDKLWDDPDQREYFVRRADGTLEKYLRPGTGLEVFGRDLKDAFLWVGTEQLRKDQFGDAQKLTRLTIRVPGKTLFDYCVAIDHIVERILSDGVRIPVIERDTAGRYAGRLLIYRYHVGSAYNGCRYTVTVEEDGAVREMTGVVANGYVIFTAQSTASSITVDLVSEL